MYSASGSEEDSACAGGIGSCWLLSVNSEFVQAAQPRNSVNQASFWVQRSYREVLLEGLASAASETDRDSMRLGMM